MSTVEKNVDVNVPVRVAYDQWTQFEDVPKFMEGVRRVDQLGDRGTHCALKSAARPRNTTPRSLSRFPTSGSHGAAPAVPKIAAWFSFHPLDANRTRVMLQMEYEPRASWRMPAT